MAGLKKISELTLWDMIRFPRLYASLSTDLVKLPLPETLTVNKKILTIPKDINEFSDSICYGQRLYFTKKEENDYSLIIRYCAGYFQPMYDKQLWSESKVLLFVKKIVTCKAIHLYPIAMHLISLMGEVADREKELLHREPTKMELAAGIEKLNIFAELNSLDFLRDAMKITVPEVLQTPYNECLVRFMNAKEINDFQLRYVELQRIDSETKNKFQK